VRTKDLPEEGRKEHALSQKGDRHFFSRGCINFTYVLLHIDKQGFWQGKGISMPL